MRALVWCTELVALTVYCWIHMVFIILNLFNSNSSRFFIWFAITELCIWYLVIVWLQSCFLWCHRKCINLEIIFVDCISLNVVWTYDNLVNLWILYLKPVWRYSCQHSFQILEVLLFFIFYIFSVFMSFVSYVCNQLVVGVTLLKKMTIIYSLAFKQINWLLCLIFLTFWGEQINNFFLHNINYINNFK